jgi:hypothetical protein
MDSPASGARPTALPTATQELTAVQDTPMSTADVGLTGCEDQVVPPSVVVRMMPRPERVPVSVLAVVPTATHQTPRRPVGVVVVVVVEAAGGEAVVVVPGTVVVVDDPDGAVVPEAAGDGGVPSTGAPDPVAVEAVVEVKGRPLPGALLTQSMPLR